MADIVDDFLSRLAQIVPNLPPDAPLALEKTLRQRWGGSEPYVGKLLSRTTREKILTQGLRQQRPLRELFEVSGVHRSTTFRMLSKK